MRPPAHSAQLRLDFDPAGFWPDVFVRHGLPWRSFLESAACHLLVLTGFWAVSRFPVLQPRVTAEPVVTRAEVIYYAPSEYLPPLDTRVLDSPHVAKADPEFSPQPIISLPREPDNRSQTVVAPPNVPLAHDAALPNMVVLIEKAPSPQMPIAPAPAVPAIETSRLSPQMDRSIIAPPPQLESAVQKTLYLPQSSVIAPPPLVDGNPARRVGDLEVAHSTIIAPAPQLTLYERRALSPRSAALSTSVASSPQVIAPPPSLPTASSRGPVIALSLHPAVDITPEPPAGNRRGTFAATPEGHRGASGAAGSAAGGAAGNGNTSASQPSGKQNGIPSGLYVGKASNSPSTVAGDPASNSRAYEVNPNLLANARPPRAPARTFERPNESKLSEEERSVFGARKFYSLTLNMPNLNSAGGSWIIRFAALKPELPSPAPRPAPAGDPTNNDPPSDLASDLAAPSATRKVDPAYPLELMRQKVGGTVILYGVIHADGTVGSVRVLRSVDDRLDHYASDAISKWQFQPATKNGAPVDVEATFSIPFRPAETTSSF